jgi:hypothetical protein
MGSLLSAAVRCRLPDLFKKKSFRKKYKNKSITTYCLQPNIPSDVTSIHASLLPEFRQKLKTHSSVPIAISGHHHLGLTERGLIIVIVVLKTLVISHFKNFDYSLLCAIYTKAMKLTHGGQSSSKSTALPSLSSHYSAFLNYYFLFRC